MRLRSFTKLLSICLLIGGSTLVGGCGGNSNNVKIIVITPALGQAGDKIPSDLANFCKLLQTGKEKSYPIVSFKRIDTDEESDLAISSFLSQLAPSGGKKSYAACEKYLSKGTISEAFSYAMPPNAEVGKKKLEKYKEDAIQTYEISPENTVDKVILDIQNRLVQDSATGKKLKYLVIYQPIPSKAVTPKPVSCEAGEHPEGDKCVKDAPVALPVTPTPAVTKAEEAKAAAEAEAKAKAAAERRAAAEAEAKAKAAAETQTAAGSGSGCSGDLNRAESLISSGEKGKALAVLNTLALNLDSCTPSEKGRHQSLVNQAK